MPLCAVRSCGFFGADRFAKYDGAPTAAMRMSGPISMAIMSSRARAVAFAIGQPEEVDVNEILFRPTRRVCGSG